MRLIEMLRGLSHGGWVPEETGNFHLYAIVLASQTLHATGYAMGIALDRALDPTAGPRDPAKDAAVLVYFGDGASSQGDVSEAMVFAASYQAPEVFFLQNNHWAISVPVERQSRTPLYLRGTGFGIPSVQIDGNDVLISYAASRKFLDETRAGDGPRFIEALTYRMGAHTSSDDPTKYREREDVAYWGARDPIVRYEAYLRSQGVGDDFFAEVAQEAEDLAAAVRARTLTLQDPPTTKIFENVYSDAHPLVDAERDWLAAYEASFGAGGAA